MTGMPKTKHAAAAAALAGFTAVSPAGAAELDATLYVAATSDYVWRGITQSDDDPAVQVGVDLAHDSGLFGGVWASTVDIETAPAGGRRREVQYYAGYALSVSDGLTVSGSAVHVAYPGARGSFRYDYTEYGVSVNIDDRIWLDYAFSPELFETGAETHNVELHLSWPLGEALGLGAGIGVYRASELPRGDYAYWDVGLTRLVGPVSIDVRYHEADGWLSFAGARDRSGSRVVVSLEYVF